jgi:hypothetical protein
MQTLKRDESDSLWDKYWDEMTDEWFKVEVHQDYSSEDIGPSLKAWMSGDRHKSIKLLEKEDHSDWIKECLKKKKQGVKLTRVHLVDEPYSRYLEWELEHYRIINIPKCGEDVFLLNYDDAKDLEIPGGDIMFFDDNRVVVNEYNPFGKMIAATFYGEEDSLNKFLQLRKELRIRMRPLGSF